MIDKKEILKQPRPPCEKFSCIFFDKCKYELLACAAFQYYVIEGMAIHPHRDHTCLAGHSVKTIRHTKPNHQQYLNIYETKRSPE